jgi:DNA-binding NtrC family response regulator
LAVPFGKSKVTQALRDQVQNAASSSSPVLFVGELGSGREAYARYLHSLSARSAKPFFMVVAASLSGDPAAALFGSERDGKTELGALDQAAGGTLYLSGLEDLSGEAQRALTGAIEQNGYTRVGGRERLPLNVRWISSAQEGFELRATSEPFRRDLLANLNVITLRVPPLREYAEDVPDLLRFYVDRLVDDQHLPLRRFSVAAQNRLRNYPWPGNVGELKNLVQRVLILGAGEEIRLEEIERELAVKLAVDEPLVKQDLLALPLREAREQFERAYLQQQLLLCNGKVGQLAKRVGMERTHLYRKLRALGVDFRQLGED